MRNWGLAAAIGAVLTVVVTLFMACGPSETSSFCSGTTCEPDGGSKGDGTMSIFGADHGAPQSLAITPAASTLAVTDLSNPPSATLSAQLTFTDGTMSNVMASWSVDRFDIASIGAGSGVVQPTGSVFGVVTVTAIAQGLTATTTITVTLKATVNLSNFSPGDVTALAGATTPNPQVTALAYPYDKTVFPTGLLAPEMMWDLGLPGDEYEVHLVASDLDLAVLTTADPPSRFTMQQSLWNTFVGSAAGYDVTVELRRLSAGSAYLCAVENWHIANANVRGLVYFWNISQGQLLKADLTVGQVSPVFNPTSGQPGSSQQLCGTNPCGSGNPRPLFPEGGVPPTPPWEDNGLGNRCVACHSVSKDGSTLAATFATGGSEGAFGSLDLATTQIDTIGDYFATGMLTAIVPDGSLAVMNTASKGMQLIDAKTGIGIPSALDALTNVCDPVFSPDGTLFALATNCTGGTNFVLEFSSSNLVIYDFAEATGVFSNPRTIVTTGAAGQSAFAFPSFSPDSKWVFFQGGNYSRAKYGTNQHGSDDIYVVSTQGGTPISLDEANAEGVTVADNLHLNYAPTVNPIAAGGYIWVVFTSPRNYGNRMVAPVPTQPAPMDTTYANHKQLWVAAVDQNIGAVDPSHAAFWMPGQDQTTANMFGYWTLAPCKPTPGDGGAPPSCTTGFECCSGFCRNLGSEGYVCTNNPGGCSQIGEKCTATSDCCGAGPSVGCVAGVCQTIAN